MTEMLNNIPKESENSFIFYTHTHTQNDRENKSPEYPIIIRYLF